MTLYHATDHPFEVGDLVDPAFSKKGKVYATENPHFAVTAAKERYKFRNRQVLSDGRELAVQIPPIHIFEVEPLDPRENTHLLDNRPGVHASTKGFVILKKAQLPTFDEIIQGPQPKTRRERIDMERIEKVDAPSRIWPLLTLLAGEAIIIAAIAAFITLWFIL